MTVKRKSRTLKQRRALRYKQTAPIGIGRSRDAIRRDKRAHRAEVIGRNREAVFHRDRVCRRCSAPGKDSDHCHEVVSRARLRGKPPEEIFTLTNCCRLCPTCHEIVTRNREFIVFTTFHGCEDQIHFVTREGYHERWPSETRAVSHGRVVDQPA
jgi:hypothetical protein